MTGIPIHLIGTWMHDLHKRNHAEPFGPERRTWTWVELKEIEQAYGMEIVADDDTCWPAQAVPLRKRRRGAGRPRKQTLLVNARKLRGAHNESDINNLMAYIRQHG